MDTTVLKQQGVKLEYPTARGPSNPLQCDPSMCMGTVGELEHYFQAGMLGQIKREHHTDDYEPSLGANPFQIVEPPLPHRPTLQQQQQQQQHHHHHQDHHNDGDEGTGSSREVREKRRVYVQQYRSKLRQSETEDERQRRLERQRVYKRMARKQIRATESTEDRAKRLARERERKKMYRTTSEPTEEREWRLARDRDRKRAMREQQRQQRLLTERPGLDKEEDDNFSIDVLTAALNSSSSVNTLSIPTPRPN